MSEFDEFMKPEGGDEYRSHQERNRQEKQERERKTSKSSSKEKRPGSLVEMLTGTDDAANLAQKFNLDPDMTERMLVPLVNLLDKYGIGENVAQSDAANSAVGIADFLSDIAPVVKGTAEYFSGKRRELSEEDKMLLEQIQQSQSVEANMSLFLGESDEDDFGFEEEPTPPPAPTPIAPPSYENPYIETGSNPFSEGVDWAEVMGMREENRQQALNANTFTDMMPASGDGSVLPGLEELAAQAGLSKREVLNNDRQRRTNNHGMPEPSMGGAHLDLGLDEIEQAMAKERKVAKNKSQIIDANLPTPDSIDDHDPLTSPMYITPSIELGQMESLSELQNKADELAAEESAMAPVTPFEDQVDDYVEEILEDEDNLLDYAPMDLMGDVDDVGTDE